MREDRKELREKKLEDEFKELLAFHAESFSDLDRKAQYWLTLCLPSFLGIIGILVERSHDFSMPLVSASSAVSVCLTMAIYGFGSTMSSKRIESGRLVPHDRKIDLVEKALSSEQEWADVRRSQISVLLESIKHNENSNIEKSKNLKIGEISLFVATPAAVLLAVAAAFAYSATSPTFGAGIASTCVAATGIAIGIATGLTALAAAFGIRHPNTR